MTGKLATLESLVQLAKEPSADKRRELLREVSGLFLEKPESLSSRETEYFSDIMGKVAFDLEMEVRQELAQRLAKVGAAPHKLMLMLANDKIEVARPVLMESGVLGNADLIEIIKRQGQDHLAAISGRKTLDEEVTDQLVERGSDFVLETLVRNEGAAFSHKSFASMTDRAESNEALQEPLASRADIPAYVKSQMLMFVSSALRRHILENIIDVDESEMDKALEDARQRLEAQHNQNEAALSAAERFIIRKERLKQLNPKLLVQLLRQGKIAEFIAGLGRLANIDTSTAHKITFDEGGETLAIVCKAIGIDRITFSDLLLLTNQEGLRDQESRENLIGVYSRITTEAAQRTIRFWRTRKQTMKSLEKKQDAATA